MPDVLIPWRPGCDHRSAALAFVTAQWGRLGYRVLVGELPVNVDWCKALAVAGAVEQSTADTIIVADADVWPADTAEIGRCVEALETAGWAIPHGDVHRLDEQATTELIATGTPGAGRAQRPYWGTAGGGIVALRRDTYIDCPLDRRFVGWGQEDESWAIALLALHGQPWRGRSDLWHLWHPPQERLNRRVGSAEGQQLQRRYRAARRDPAAMRALIEEAA